MGTSHQLPENMDELGQVESFLKWGYPTMDGGKSHSKEMIWGYPYFRKPPFGWLFCGLPRLEEAVKQTLTKPAGPSPDTGGLPRSFVDFRWPRYQWGPLVVNAIFTLGSSIFHSMIGCYCLGLFKSVLRTVNHATNHSLFFFKTTFLLGWIPMLTTSHVPLHLGVACPPTPNLFPGTWTTSWRLGHWLVILW